MKPLKLEIQAFGPYVELQTIDFEALSERGMFLIKGPTGSGKTTIFDAMTFALYGGGSGENEKLRSGRNDLEEWRCSQAEKGTSTVVSLTFSVRGRKYRFTRSLTPKRVNYSALYEAGELDDAGNVIPFFSNPKKDDLTKKAEELVGLTKEQFRQVVLLPQGQFERFLTAASTEKEDILKKIFDSEQWERYAQSFFNAASSRKTALDRERDAVAASLAEENAATIAELAQRIEMLKCQRAENLASHEAFDAPRKQAQLNADILLSEQFRPLRELEKRLAWLQSVQAEMTRKKADYLRAEKAEALRGILSEFESAERDREKRERELRENQAMLPAAERNQAAAQEKKNAHEEASPAAALQSRIGEYEARRAVYENLARLKERCVLASENFRRKQEQARQAETAWQSGLKKAREAFTASEQAEAAAKDFRMRYYAGIYGELASGLACGEPCPVCGSTHHPAPAEKTPDSVGKSAMEAGEAAAVRAKKVWQAADAERLRLEALKSAAAEAMEPAQRAVTEAHAFLQNARENLVEGIGDLRALDGRIQELRNAIRIDQEESRKLQLQLNTANESLSRLRAKTEAAGVEYAGAVEACGRIRSELAQALAEQGYADYPAAKQDLLPAQVRKALHEQIVAYARDTSDTTERLDRMREALAGREEPDRTGFDQRQKEITAETAAFTKRDSELQTVIDRLETKWRTLQKKADHYEGQIRQAEDDLAFARKLRGDTGIGLQRYVLAIMFNQVIGEANRMLEKVHGGRYHLFRTDDKGAGNKRGLELKVHDSRSPEKEGRGVAMLSGGEKFLVSLALSIGMSTVAQKSGVQIEALFIDEGFGTLDDNSIQDAMEVLDSVRRSSGMIGIISHVQLLEDHIPTHLEVIKASSGSSVVLR